MKFLMRATLSLVLAVVVGAVGAVIIGEYLGKPSDGIFFTLFIFLALTSFVIFMKWGSLSFAFRGFVALLLACVTSYFAAGIVTQYFQEESNIAYAVGFGCMIAALAAIIVPIISRKAIGSEMAIALPMPFIILYGIFAAVLPKVGTWDGYTGLVPFVWDVAYAGGWLASMWFAPSLPFYLAFLLALGGSYARENPTMRTWFSFGRGGAARWAGPYSYGENYDTTAKGGIFLGATLFLDTLIKMKIWLRYNDDAHLVTIAQSGAGKSVTSLWPNLRQYNAPMVIIDPKGEHADFSADSRSGYILDPYGRVQKGEDELSHMMTNYNPLGEIDIHDDGARGLIQAISGACVMEDAAKDPHFPEAAKTVIEGVIAHVLSRLPPEEQSLPRVADMFQGFNSELGVADADDFDDVITDMSTNDAAGRLPMLAAGVLQRAADRERGSILTTCFRSLKWITDPPMSRHLTAKPHSVLRNVVRANDKTSLYIVLPFEYMEENSQIRWMRMLINLMNVHMFRNPRNKEGQRKLLFVLDEFPKLRYMKSLEEGIVTARGAGMKYWILLQQIGQLKTHYGDNWESFLGSSNVQAFGVSDDATAQWIANALGGERDSSSGQHALMRADEVRQFLGKEEPTQIVIPVTGMPLRLERLGFKRIKKFHAMD